MDSFHIAAAEMAHFITVLSANSNALFFNAFLRLPEGKKYPPKKSMMLFNEILSFCCFSLWAHLEKREIHNRNEIVDLILDIICHGQLADVLRNKYDDYIEQFGKLRIEFVKEAALDCIKNKLLRIHRKFRKYDKYIDRYVSELWGVTYKLAEEKVSEN